MIFDIFAFNQLFNNQMKDFKKLPTKDSNPQTQANKLKKATPTQNKANNQNQKLSVIDDIFKTVKK